MKRLAMKRLLGGACMICAVGAAAFHTRAYAQWVQTNGPQGGSITTVVADDSRIMFVAARDIYQSTGGAWTKVGTIGDFGGFNYQAGGDRLLLAKGVLLASGGNGVYRSTDYGASWSRVTDAGALVSDGSSFYRIYDGALYTSADGAEWMRSGSYSNDLGLPVFFKGAIIASGNLQGELHRTVDGGTTWETMTTDLPAEGWGGRVLAAGADAIYATNPGNRGVFKSTDGAAWTDITADLPVGGFIYRMSVQENVLWANTSEGLYRWSGSGWEQVQVPIANVLASSNGDVVIATNQGLYEVDTRSMQVNQVNTGIIRSSAATLGAVGDAVIANTNDGIYRSLDEGATWEHVENFYAYEFVEHRGVIYSRGDGIFGSDNQGRTWRRLGPYWEFEVEGNPIRSDLAGLAAYDGILYLGAGSINNIEGGNSWSTGGVFRSTNNGITWTDISAGLPIDCATYTPVGDVVAGEGFVVISTAAGPYRSTNRGDSWQPAYNGLPITDFYNHSAMLFKVGSRIYYNGRIGAFQSADGGASWTPLEPAIPDGFRIGSYYSIIGDRMYVTVYKDVDTTTLRRIYIFDGSSWKDITHTEPAGVELHGFAQVKGTLFAGSQEHGVWKTGDPTVVRVAGVRGPSPSADAPSAALTPNPTRGSTELRFTLTSRAHARVSLVNAIGQTVGIMHDGVLEAGAHTESIDTKGLAAGAYFVRIETAGETRVERLVKID